MAYRSVTYPVHHYESGPITAEIEAEVFGSGFLHLKAYTEDRRPEAEERERSRMILIDPEDLDHLEVAIKEAKRRRNSSARRRRRRLEKERRVASTG